MNHRESEGEEPTCDSCSCHHHGEEPKVQAQPVMVSIANTELDQLKNELTDYKDKYLRLLADAENARKRLQKERKDIVDYAVQNAVIDLLHPLDHLENALKFAKEMSDEIKQWAFGFEMILTQFRDALAANGIVAFESLGKVFDPHIHEAVETVEIDSIPAGVIVEECTRGYKMGERVIRPARVKVAKAISKE
jgi:molecular chaperone GrpE